MPSPQPAATIAPPSRSRFLVRAAALMPFWLFLALFATGQFNSFFGPPPPEIMGIPLGAWMIALAAGWMLIGVALVWGTRSRLTEMFVLLLFTIPATILLVLGPAVILILQNLS